MSRLIKQKVRDVDVLCRWGGEEFLLLLENCDQQHAARVAETIREAISEHKIRIKDDSISVTISAGRKIKDVIVLPFIKIASSRGGNVR